MPNLSAQAQKFSISMKKRIHRASVVRGKREVIEIFQGQKKLDDIGVKFHKNFQKKPDGFVYSHSKRITMSSAHFNFFESICDLSIVVSCA